MKHQQHRRLILALILLLWPLAVGRCPANGFPFSESQTKPVRVSQRTIDGLAALDLTQLAPSADRETWTLAQVAPGPDSAGIAANIIVENGNPDIRWRGTFQIIAALTATGLSASHPPAKWSYLFRVPWNLDPNQNMDPNRRPSVDEMMERYAPFGGGGLALFHLEGDPAVAGSLTTPPDLPCYCIPDAWEQDLQPDRQFLLTYAALFAPKAAAHNQAALRKLLDSPRPFIAVAACRTLTQANLFSLPQMQSVLSQARGVRQAVFLRLMLQGPPGKELEEKEWAARLGLVSGLAAQATDASDLAGIVAGLYAYSEYKYNSALITTAPAQLAGDPVNTALNEVRRRLSELGPRGKADPVTQTILDVSKAP